MAPYPNPDATLDLFAADLARSAAESGWTLVRFQRSHSDRAFELRGNGRASAFTAKISQTEKGFWGLTDAKAREMADSQREHLLLLTGASSGYFVSSVALRRLLPKFSRTQEGAVRINENVVRKEARFSDTDEAFDLLKARSILVAV